MQLTSIAQGRTAEIYAWKEGQVLKLYREWCPPDWAEYESRIAHSIHEAGIPSPAAGDIIEVNGRRGLVYERVDGISMLQDLNARPWTLLKNAHRLAELQVGIHQKSIPGLPTYKDRLRYDVRTSQHLSEGLRDKSLAQLDTLPDGGSVCHGDYHPGNVIITPTGPVIIDWMTACSGSPWADVARTSLILSIGPKSAGKQVSVLVRMVIKLYHHAYLRQYQGYVSDQDSELGRWLPVIAAARLNEQIDPEREALLKLTERI